MKKLDVKNIVIETLPLSSGPGLHPTPLTKSPDKQSPFKISSSPSEASPSTPMSTTTSTTSKKENRASRTLSIDFGRFRQASGTSGTSTSDEKERRKSNNRLSKTLSIDSDFDYLTMSREKLRTPSKIVPEKLNSLQKATFNNNVKKVQKLLAEKYRDVNKVDTYHQCVSLHIAAELNRMDIAKIFLDPTKNSSISWGDLDKKQAKTNLQNLEGRTPFLLVFLLNSGL